MGGPNAYSVLYRLGPDKLVDDTFYAIKEVRPDALDFISPYAKQLNRVFERSFSQNPSIGI